MSNSKVPLLEMFKAVLKLYENIFTFPGKPFWLSHSAQALKSQSAAEFGQWALQN
jgi:hypothetical protein